MWVLAMIQTAVGEFIFPACIGEPFDVGYGVGFGDDPDSRVLWTLIIPACTGEPV